MTALNKLTHSLKREDRFRGVMAHQDEIFNEYEESLDDIQEERPESMSFNDDIFLNENLI